MDDTEAVSLEEVAHQRRNLGLVLDDEHERCFLHGVHDRSVAHGDHRGR
jgi:hypothetical protein